MNDIAEISQVRRTSDEAEVNRLLSEGWKLQYMAPNGMKIIYLLVKAG